MRWSEVTILRSGTCDFLRRYAIGVTALFVGFSLTCSLRRQCLPVEAPGDPVFEVYGGEMSALHDAEWQKTRNEAVKPCCDMCGASDELQVHHVLPWHLYQELRHEYTNLVTLCQPCHFRFGHGRNWQSYNPDVRNLAETVRNSLTNVVTRAQYETGGTK